MPWNPLQGYRPESLDTLRARYHLALEHIFDIESAMLGVAEFPVVRPECTFDTVDGIRFIVSREDVGGHHPDLHVSASIRAGSPMADHFAREARRSGHDVAMGRFAALALNRYRKISGDTAPFTDFEWSEDMGVPHWRRTEI